MAPVPEGLPGSDLAATVGLRRLTAREYDETVHALLGHPLRAASTYLPPDLSKPFENDYSQQQQQISDSLVEGADLLAGDIARSLLKDIPRRDKVVGCGANPAPGDAKCLREFVTRFGRRALRRPLRDEEIAVYMGLQSIGVREGKFFRSVEAIVRTFLQEPEFLHRLEIGTQVLGSPGLYRLNDFEMASRLSYFLWGNMPSDALLARAEGHGLMTPEQVRGAAIEMLADRQAAERIARFHALWLNYANLATHPYVSMMQDETNELIKRVVFVDKRPWQDLFRSTESFLTYDLAGIYSVPNAGGLQKGGPAKWVSYEGTKRRGILSHGTFLSLGAKFGDTSPTVRGKAIRERLFCQRIPPPEEVLGMAVDTDQPPKAPNNSPCKKDRYQANRDLSPQCAACHNMTDLVGFGLENYDTMGKYRQVDKDPVSGKTLTQCRISGEGELDGKSFVGPAGLADLLVATDKLNECALGQLYRFAMGRTTLDQTDEKFLAAVLDRIGTKDFRFDEVLLDFVSSPAFGYRRADATQN